MLRLFLFTVLLAANLAPALQGDTRYMVDYLLPRGGARGATVDVEFHGISLENPKEILFYQPGIKATNFVPYAKPGARPGDGFKVKFQIAPDCPLGEHVLRVRTATALTDAVTFWVSRYRTEYEFEDKIGQNDTIEKARPIPMNVTVEGQILPGPDMDVDMYRIQAQKGRRISVEVEAARLGTLHFGGENDLAVRILDAAGRELGKNDDSALYVQDPVLSILAPADGAYFIEIKQQVFYPPRQAWYRAHIGDFSRPSAIFPAGGQSAAVLEARILGDPAGERIEKIQLPAKTGNFDYYPEGAPSPNVLRVSPYPNVLFAAASGPTPVPALPAALNGILDKPGQPHTFRFSARKGEAWNVHVYARTLGAPVDPRIWIAAAGAPKHLLDADDARLIDLGEPSARGTWYIKDQQDPVSIFKVPSDGDYILGIEDAGNAYGPDHVYRIEIEPVRDIVYTHITMSDGYQVPRLTGLIVPQGNRWTLDVQLAQGLGNNYKGELDLEAVGLPRGVTMIAPRVTRGLMRVPVQFVAQADAEQQAALIQILARPADKAARLQSASRQGFALVNRPGEYPWHYVFLDRYALAVTQPAPFHIELEQPPIALAQSGELLLKVKLLREPGFNDAVEIQPDWLPNGVSKEGTVTIAAGKDEAVFRIQANDKAPPGVYKFAMNASTTGGDASSGVGRIRASSAFVELKVAGPYLAVDLQRGSVERGNSSELVGVLKQSKPFPGKARLVLQQLPKGVKMVEPAPQVTAKDSAVVFHIEAAPDALAGLYKGITCEISFTEEGQQIRQHTGSGILRIDEPRSVGLRPADLGAK